MLRFCRISGALEVHCPKNVKDETEFREIKGSQTGVWQPEHHFTSGRRHSECFSFALKRCGHTPVCAHAASTRTVADWLGSGQSKRSAGVCSAKRDAGDFARVLPSSAECSIPERAGWFQAAPRSHFCFDRVGNRGRSFTRAVRYRIFSARTHSAAKCTQLYF